MNYSNCERRRRKKKIEEDRVTPYAVSTKHIDIEYNEQEHLVLQLMLFPLVKIGLLPAASNCEFYYTLPILCLSLKNQCIICWVQLLLKLIKP